jgi:hypothetical protein
VLHQFREIVEAQLGKIGEILRQQIVESRDQLQQQTREELRSLVAEMRRQFSQESMQYLETGAKIEAQVEEVRTFRDYLESLLRVLPETLDQRVEKRVAAAAEQLEDRVQKGITAQTQSQAEQFSRRLAELGEQARGTLLDQLEEELRHRQQELSAKLEERGQQLAAKVMTAETHSQTEQFSRRLAELGEQAHAGLQIQLEEQLGRQRQELSDELEKRGRQLVAAAANALPRLEEKLWTNLKERLGAEFDQRQAELRQALEATRSETARLQERTEKLAARLDTKIGVGVEEAVAERVGRAREVLERSRELSQRAQQALVNLGDQASSSVRERLEGAFHQHRQAVEQALEAARTEVARVEGQVGNLVGRLHSELDQAVADSVERAREQLEGTVASIRDGRTSETQAELDGRLVQLRQQADQLAQSTTLQFQQQLEQVAHAEARVQNLVTGMHSELDQAMTDTVARAREQLEGTVALVRQGQTGEAQAELDRRLGEFHQQADWLAQQTAKQFQEQLENVAQATAARMQETLESMDHAMEYIFRALRQMGLEN